MLHKFKAVVKMHFFDFLAGQPSRLPNSTSEDACTTEIFFINVQGERSVTYSEEQQYNVNPKGS